MRKGSTRASTSRSMSLINFVNGVDLLQMQAQQKAVMPGDAAAQRFAQRLGRRLDAAMRQLGQPLRIALAGDQGFDHLAAGQTHDVGDRRVELDVGVFQRLLQALDMPAALPRQLLAGAPPVAHLLGLLIRHKAAADQATGQQIGQPGGVVDVGLAPGHVLDVHRICQHQGEIGVAQDMPDRLPVDPGRMPSLACNACLMKVELSARRITTTRPRIWFSRVTRWPTNFCEQ